MSDTIPPLVLEDWNPAVQLPGFLADEAAIFNGTATSGVTIDYNGDSETLGFATQPSDFVATSSVPAQVTQDLVALGLPANQADFSGAGNEESVAVIDARVALIGNTILGYPPGAGGQSYVFLDRGDGVSFDPQPGTYSTVTVNTINEGVAALNVTVNGVLLGTIQDTNTGLLRAATFDLPMPEAVANVTVTDATDGQPAWVQGVSLGTATPSVQVVNDGYGGEFSGYVGAGQPETSIYNVTPINETHGLLEIDQDGTNDFLSGNVTPGQAAANIDTILAEQQSMGQESIIVIPDEVDRPGWATWAEAYNADIEANDPNTPIINLAATMGYDSGAAQVADGDLIGDGVHQSAAFDAALGHQEAALLLAPITQATINPPGMTTATPHVLLNAGGPDTLDVSMAAIGGGNPVHFAFVVDGGQFGGFQDLAANGTSTFFDLTGNWSGQHTLQVFVQTPPGQTLFVQGANLDTAALAGSVFAVTGSEQQTISFGRVA